MSLTNFVNDEKERMSWFDLCMVRMRNYETV